MRDQCAVNGVAVVAAEGEVTGESGRVVVAGNSVEEVQGCGVWIGAIGVSELV